MRGHTDSVACRHAVLRVAAMVMMGLAAAGATAGTCAAGDNSVGQKIPRLSYHFTWLTFLLTISLVIGYYAFVLMMSEREFRGIVDERFGRAPSEGADETAEEESRP